VLASNSTSLRLGIIPDSCFELYLTLHSYLVSECLLDGQLAKPIFPKIYATGLTAPKATLLHIFYVGVHVFVFLGFLKPVITNIVLSALRC